MNADFKKVEIDNGKWTASKIEVWLLSIIIFIFALIIIGGIINLTYNNERNITSIEGVVKEVKSNQNYQYLYLYDEPHCFVFRTNSISIDLNDVLVIDSHVKIYVLINMLETNSSDLEIYGLESNGVTLIDYMQSLKDHQRSFYFFMAFFLPLIVLCIIRMHFIVRRMKCLNSKVVKDSIENLLEYQRNNTLFRYMSLKERINLHLSGRTKIYIPTIVISLLLILSIMIILFFQTSGSVLYNVFQIIANFTTVILIMHILFIEKSARFNNVKGFCDAYRTYLNNPEYHYRNRRLAKTNKEAYEIIKKRYVNLKNQMIVDFHHDKMVCQYINRINDGLAFFEIAIKDLNLKVKTRYVNDYIPCCLYICSDIKNTTDINNDVVLVLNNRLYQWIKNNNIEVEGLEETLNMMEENIKSIKFKPFSSGYKGIVK